ncbi:hypothetical protein [Desulfomonile tiedjei]|uniref:Uncharacterized protein n=1 Tax=Desulfomonile tiedjei (strain ATCC 49306 / DSM 6799 / DCB-1) TaxID=706587 RepID=I4CE25_DESTA|nr:hypothetical protein [Desulfomonile tiedjei]AFM27816.1 hypothetical protein Desti_5219 [Desulfomonile tiedjei DSM 6799]
MENSNSIQAYSTDIYEVRYHLLDRGFRQCVELMDAMPAPQLQALIGAAFTVQHSRDINRGRNYRGICLLQKIRQEQGWSVEDFRSALSQFAKTDLSEQRKAWRESQDSFAKAVLSPNDYKIWKQSVSSFAVMQKWLKANPEPLHVPITLELVMSIEANRPRREKYKGYVVELYERFFARLTNYDLTWEALLAPLGSRDPRAHLTPISEKTGRKAS